MMYLKNDCENICNETEVLFSLSSDEGDLQWPFSSLIDHKRMKISPVTIIEEVPSSIVVSPQDPELQTILQQLRSPNEEVQLKGATAARQNLSEEVDPPLDRYIQAGILPILLQLLQKDHQ